MRPIDADALPRLTQIFEANGKRMEQEVVLAKIIDNTPTVDAVPVVRCKDCKHWLKGDGSCFPHADWNDFCSNGERSE